MKRIAKRIQEYIFRKSGYLKHVDLDKSRVTKAREQILKINNEINDIKRFIGLIEANKSYLGYASEYDWLNKCHLWDVYYDNDPVWKTKLKAEHDDEMRNKAQRVKYYNDQIVGLQNSIGRRQAIISRIEDITFREYCVIRWKTFIRTLTR